MKNSQRMRRTVAATLVLCAAPASVRCFVPSGLSRTAVGTSPWSRVAALGANDGGFDDWEGLEGDLNVDGEGEGGFDMQRLVERVSLTYGLDGFGGRRIGGALRGDLLNDELGRRPVPEDVFIVMFNPNTEDEGVHTLEYPRNSGQNVLLAFESVAECVAFAENLANQNFHRPTSQYIPLSELEKFCCGNSALEMMVVPAGTRLTPPRENKDVPDFDPGKKKERRVNRTWGVTEEGGTVSKKSAVAKEAAAVREEELRKDREALERMMGLDGPGPDVGTGGGVILDEWEDSGFQ